MVSKFLRVPAYIAFGAVVFGTVVVPLALREFSDYGPIPDSVDSAVSKWLAAHPYGSNGPSDKTKALAALGDLANAIDKYERDGFVVVRNALDPATVRVLRALVDYTYEQGNLSTKWTTKASCVSNQFSPTALVPRLRQVLYSLPIHWAAQRLMGADAVNLISDIVHANPRNCDGMGYLMTHSDMNTAPFNMTTTRSSLGDNSMVVWIALDEMSEDTISMAMGRGSHKYFSQRRTSHGNPLYFEGDDYCDMWHEHLAQEKAHDKTFTDRFESVKLGPGDALFFHGLAYHKPLYSCQGPAGCNLTNTRRITLRYIDSDRTVFRTDEGRSSHQATRRCGFMGLGCRYQLGQRVRDAKHLPVVVDESPKANLREDLDENYLRDGQSPRKSEWYMHIGSGLIVHHQTCSIEYAIVKNMVAKLAEKYLPAWLSQSS